MPRPRGEVGSQLLMKHAGAGNYSAPLTVTTNECREMKMALGCAFAANITVFVPKVTT